MFPKLDENYLMFQTLMSDTEGTFVFLTQMIRSSPTLKKNLGQCFSNFVRPRPSKFFFIRREPGPNRFTLKYLSVF